LFPPLHFSNLHSLQILRLNTLSKANVYIQTDTTYPCAVVMPGNKTIITTITIAHHSDSELAYLLSHSLAHLRLRHKREQDSREQLLTPFFSTIIFLDLKMYLAQWPLLWMLETYYFGKNNRKQEMEAEWLATAICDMAGVGVPTGKREGLMCAQYSSR